MVDQYALKSFGDFGESWVVQFLAGLGVKCDYGPPADLVTGKVSIEVKISRLTQWDKRHSNRFQFCLYRESHTEFRADFLVCLCCPDGQRVTEAYVIPSQSIDHKHKLVIQPTGYKGKWAIFRDAWESILTHPDIEWGEHV